VTAFPTASIDYACRLRDYLDGGTYTAPNGVHLGQAFTSNTAAVQAALNRSVPAAVRWAGRPTEGHDQHADNWLTSSGALGFAGRADAQEADRMAGDRRGTTTARLARWASTYYPSLADTWRS